MQVGPIFHLKSLPNDRGTGPQSASGQPSLEPFGRRQLSWAVSHYVARGSDTLGTYVQRGRVSLQACLKSKHMSKSHMQMWPSLCLCSIVSLSLSFTEPYP